MNPLTITLLYHAIFVLLLLTGHEQGAFINLLIGGLVMLLIEPRRKLNENIPQNN